jgi:hypothetical protein
MNNRNPIPAARLWLLIIALPILSGPHTIFAQRTGIAPEFNSAAGINKRSTATSASKQPPSIRREFNSNAKPSDKVDQTRRLSLQDGPRPPSILQEFNRQALLKAAIGRGNEIHKRAVLKQRASAASRSSRPAVRPSPKAPRPRR